MLGFYSSQDKAADQSALCKSSEASIDELASNCRQHDCEKVRRSVLIQLFEIAPLIDLNHQNNNLKFRRANSHHRHPPARETRGISTPHRAMGLPAPKRHHTRAAGTNNRTELVLHHPDWLFKVLVKKLQKSKQYRLSIASKDPTKAVLKTQDPLVPRLKATVDIDEIIRDRNSLLPFCCSTKENSMIVQDCIETTDAKTLRHISLILTENLDVVTLNKFSNYIVQKLCQRDSAFLEETTIYMMANFDFLLEDEYASRIMQVLVELSQIFRRFCLTKLQDNLPSILKSISAVFLVSAIIKFSRDTKDIEFLLEIIGSDPSLLHCKYFKRVMVTYVDACTTSQLAVAVRVLNFRDRLCHFLEDKYSAYICLMLIQRHDSETIRELISTITDNPIKIFSQRFFGFLLTKVIDLQNPKINGMIKEAILAISPVTFETILHCISEETGFFILYLLLSIGPVERQHFNFVQTCLEILQLPLDFCSRIDGKANQI